ncbi:hypothetical protein GCK32_004030 [Trichostrongylus colubriformis]|uniref:Uncharacterized protein n=1 Tax=Trichostrongylus colubriformis TaxID=6319 RepID=A0AAN8IEP8_TRICO
MEKKSGCLPSRNSSRPDRSRSPHREVHPWERGGEPKSVLYPADIQFHRQSTSKANSSRSPMKPSNSPSKNYRKSPLKEQSQSSFTRPNPAPLDPCRSVEKVAERMKKWSKMRSPPKFMAGLKPKGDEDVCYKSHQLTPKRRNRESWTIEHFTKEPFVLNGNADGNKNGCIDKSHPLKENMRVIERPRRRSESSPTHEEWNERSHDRYTIPAPCEPTLIHHRVEIDEDGYAVPLTQSGAVTPSDKDAPVNLTTPGNLVSPEDMFYTPMTHIRPSQLGERSRSHLHGPLKSPHFSPPIARPQFSLITSKGNVSALHSPFDRNISLKERTEAQLAAIDKVSSKLELAIQQARDVLSKPIRLGLPPLDTSAVPSFSESRQTIDPGQIENLKRMKKGSEVASQRHSLPMGFDFSKYRDLSNTSPDSALDHNVEKKSNDTNTASARAREPSDSKSSPSKFTEISQPKALGASMAAELAYAERMEKSQSHLAATRTLARTVEKSLEIAQDSQQNQNSDIDAVLDSIVLEDRSLVTFEDAETHSNLRKSPEKVHTKPTPSKIRPCSTSSKVMCLDEEEQNQRKAEIASYIRMRKKLRILQLAVLRLEKRSKASLKQSTSIDRAIERVNKEHQRAVEDAESLLTQRLTPREFLLIIKHRQRKVFDATEQCCDTIKRLVNSDPPQPREPLASVANEASTAKPDREAMRMDTKALKESETNDEENLSARTMRRNLEARREQAEMLNRSFEERSRDIEEKTKKSIAVQLTKYDRVIAERTNLLNHLEKISNEHCYEVSAPPPRTPTPHHEGIARLDLSQLSQDDPFSSEMAPDSHETPTLVDGEQLNFDEERRGVTVCRTRSQSTVYEDSLSHFDDEEERPHSGSSEATLYQSDLEIQDQTVPAEEAAAHRHPSRRTMDTAETLAMLSRSVVAVTNTTSEGGDVDVKIQSIINDALHDKVMPQVGTDLTTRLNTSEAVEEIGSELMVPDDGSCATDARDIDLVGADGDPMQRGEASKVDKHELNKSHCSESKAGGDHEAMSSSRPVLSKQTGDAGVDSSETRKNLGSETINSEKATVVTRPPKDFSRLRLFFGSPDEPTEDSADYQPTDDGDIPNDQFVSKTEPTSEMIADDTDESDQVLETAPVNDDENVPVVVLKRFVYKESVMYEKYQEDTELEKTQWEVTPPGSPVIKDSQSSSVQRSTFNDAFVLEPSETQKSDGTSNDLDEIDEKNEWLTDDEQPPVNDDCKGSSDEIGEQHDKREGHKTPKGSPVVSPSAQKELQTTSTEETKKVGLSNSENGGQQDRKTVDGAEIGELDLAVARIGKEAECKTVSESFAVQPDEIGSGKNREMEQMEKCQGLEASEERRDSSKSDNMVEGRSIKEGADILKSPSEISSPATEGFKDISEIWPETSKNHIEMEEPAKQLSDISLLERTSGRESMGLNRSDLCDSLSKSIMQLMVEPASPRRASLSQIVHRYKLSESLLEDSVTTSSESPRTPQERFTTKMPPSYSPRSIALLEETLDSSVVEMIVQCETAKAITDEKIREIDEQMASLKIRSPPVVKDETKLNTSFDESYEDLLSIEKPSSAFDKIDSTPLPTGDLLSKHVADTPRKLPYQSQSPTPSPEDIRRQRHAQLMEKLNSPEWMQATCSQYSKDVWYTVTSRGFMRPLHDEFVPFPKYDGDALVETEDERKLVDNKKTIIWSTVIELATMLWPEHPENSAIVGSKWLPIPTNDTQFAAMAVRYMQEQLGDLPSSHRYNRQCRPPAPSPTEGAIDEAVARLYYSRGNVFARAVDAEYRKMCGELIDLVGDRFVSSEIQKMSHHLGAEDDMNESLLTPSSSTAFGRLSGDFGRLSLARLSIGSGSSIGRRSSANAVIVQPLKVVHEE